MSNAKVSPEDAKEHSCLRIRFTLLAQALSFRFAEVVAHIRLLTLNTIVGDTGLVDLYNSKLKHRLEAYRHPSHIRSHSHSLHQSSSGSVKEAGMAGPVRQPIDQASLERYLEKNVPEIKTPLDLKQVGARVLGVAEAGADNE